MDNQKKTAYSANVEDCSGEQKKYAEMSSSGAHIDNSTPKNQTPNKSKKKRSKQKFKRTEQTLADDSTPDVYSEHSASNNGERPFQANPSMRKGSGVPLLVPSVQKLFDSMKITVTNNVKTVTTGGKPTQKVDETVKSQAVESPSKISKRKTRESAPVTSMPDEVEEKVFSKIEQLSLTESSAIVINKPNADVKLNRSVSSSANESTNTKQPKRKSKMVKAMFSAASSTNQNISETKTGTPASSADSASLPTTTIIQTTRESEIDTVAPSDKLTKTSVAPSDELTKTSAASPDELTKTSIAAIGVKQRSNLAENIKAITTVSNEKNKLLNQKSVPATSNVNPAKSYGGPFTKFNEALKKEKGQTYLDQLSKNFIHLLKKKAPKYPNAHFYCRLCEYHVDTVRLVEEHMKDDNHARRRELEASDKLLKNMPEPTSQHVEVVSEFLETVYEDQCMSENNVLKLKAEVESLENLLKKSSPILEDVKLRLYGSLLNGFALKNSNVNIRIVCSAKSNLGRVLKTILEVLRQEDKVYCNVVDDFEAKIPSILFSLKSAENLFHLQFNDDSCEISGHLLKYYSTLHTKIKQLGVLFAYLAKLCHISDQEQGTLPSYCFPIMSVFFCQRCVSVPVMFQDEDIRSLNLLQLCTKISDVQSSNVQSSKLDDVSLGKLWIDMLKFYSVGFERSTSVISIINKNILNKSDKRWTGKKLGIEDPGMAKRNIARTVSHPKVFDFIIDQIRLSYAYFSIPQTVDGPVFTKLSKPVSSKESMEEKVVSEELSEQDVIMFDEQIERSSSPKGLLNEMISADTAQDKLAHDQITTDIASGGNGQSNDSRVSCDAEIIVAEYSKASFTVDADVNSQSKECRHPCDSNNAAVVLITEECSVDVNSQLNDDNQSGDATDATDVSTAETRFNSDQVKNNNDFSVVEEQKKADKATLKTSTENEENQTEEGVVYDKTVVDLLKKENLFFTFDESKFQMAASKVPVFCGVCQHAGHHSRDCLDESLPPCAPLPPPSADHLNTLSEILIQIKKQNEMSPGDVDLRERFVNELTRCIFTLYDTVNLQLFGSTCNGFGFPDSDLDICMTFKDKQHLDGLDSTTIINNLAHCLHELPDLKNINPIPTAKVPIVKFYSRYYKLEGDISLYNILAQRNTNLLRCYSGIDPRVKILGFVIKEFAKKCDIGDASKGSLSSYAYILLLIHYLQRCDPPVIPVLQEMYFTDEQPEVIVEGWNTWFLDVSNEELANEWPEYGKNQQSVAELWIGLVNYYAQIFNYKTMVVTIKQKESLSKFEKLWNSDTLAIEDPFDLKHNLGSGLSKKMNSYILRAFIKAREHFSKPITTNRAITLYRYFFDSAVLTDGTAVPNDRGCRICGKIGHIAKVCPVVVARKEKDRRIREDKKYREKAKQQQRKREEHRIEELYRAQQQHLQQRTQHQQIHQQHMQQQHIPHQQYTQQQHQIQIPELPHSIRRQHPPRITEPQHGYPSPYNPLSNRQRQISTGSDPGRHNLNMNNHNNMVYYQDFPSFATPPRPHAHNHPPMPSNILSQMLPEQQLHVVTHGGLVFNNSQLQQQAHRHMSEQGQHSSS